jgi:hypothetical protein
MGGLNRWEFVDWKADANLINFVLNSSKFDQDTIASLFAKSPAPG